MNSSVATIIQVVKLAYKAALRPEFYWARNRGLVGGGEEVDISAFVGGVAGHLSDRNDPELHPELFRFPEIAHTRRMTSTPYMEASAGIDNIFRILRVDYVWRLTYRDGSDISRGGLRIALHFTF